MIKNFLKRSKIHKIKKIMRGRRILIKNENLIILNDIKIKMEDITFIKKNNFYDHLITSNTDIDINRSYIQYLKLKIFDRNLNAVLQIYQTNKKPIIYPIPKKLFKIFEEYNIKINKPLSSISFFVFSIKNFTKGSFFFIKFLTDSFFSKSKNKLKSEYYYFNNIEGDLFKFNEISEFSIFHWLNKKSNKKLLIAHDYKKSKIMKHKNNSLFYIKYPFPLLSSFKEYMRFIYCYFKILVISFSCLITGKLSYFILFDELLKSSIIKICNKNSLASKYFFNNSSPVYRPIWTYEAEILKSQIYFYFYSTNNNFINTKFLYEKYPSWWVNMSWPNYLVWNYNQKKFIEKCTLDFKNISVIGPILNNSFSKIQINEGRKIISIFDVQPFRKSLFKDTIHINDFYQPPISNIFISDIVNSNLIANYSIYLKQKRDIKNLVNPVYKNYLKFLLKKKLINIYNYDVSILSIIKASELIICMPYTSVAYIANHLNKKSIYYDPTGEVIYDDLSSNGVPLISGIDNLRNWLSKNV